MIDKPRVLVLFSSVVLFGAERGNIEALSVLKEAGAEILCLVSDERWNTIVPPVLEERGFFCKKTSYIQISRRIGWRKAFIGNCIKFVRANVDFIRAVLRFKPTHIHAYGQAQILNFLPGLLLFTKVPLVFRAGDEATLHASIWRLSWRFALRRTTTFVANSQFVARSLRLSGVRPEKIATIYNRAPARPHLPGSKLQLDLPADVRSFAYIGQIAEHKGPHVLIDAFRDIVIRFPRARLILAGRISDWEGDAWARELRDRTRGDPSIAERVIFLGEIEDVATLLAACEALVVPSLFDDPAPNVVMEAKQAGKPVIAFPRGGLPELVEHGVDGLLCTDATEAALVEAIKIYLENPQLPGEHGAAAFLSSARLGNQEFDAKWRHVYAGARFERPETFVSEADK